jgi:hypothetical protein
MKLKVFLVRLAHLPSREWALEFGPGVRRFARYAFAEDATHAARDARRDRQREDREGLVWTEGFLPTPTAPAKAKP